MPLCLMDFMVRPRYDALDHSLRLAKYFVPVAQDLANIFQAYLSKCFSTYEQEMRNIDSLNADISGYWRSGED